MGLISILEPRDWLLFGTLLGMVTVMTRIQRPALKAVVMTLPIHFTLTSFSLSRPVGATHLLGVGLLVLFAEGVPWSYATVRLPIVLLIALNAVVYGMLSVLLAPGLSGTEVEFWGLGLLLFGTVQGLLALQKTPPEPPVSDPVAGHRKLLILAGVLWLLVLLKQQLQGFMTMFPMMGVVAAYEFRKDLGYLRGKMLLFARSAIPMIGAIHVLQPVVGLVLALVGGWVVFLCTRFRIPGWQRLAISPALIR